MIDHVPLLYRCQALVAAQIENYVKYPAAPKGGIVQPRRVMASLHQTQAAVAGHK